LQELPALPLYIPVYSYGVDTQVQGVQISPLYDPSDRFANFTSWYLLTPRWNPAITTQHHNTLLSRGHDPVRGRSSKEHFMTIDASSRRSTMLTVAIGFWKKGISCRPSVSTNRSAAGIAQRVGGGRSITGHG
jgi:hypothetical protein